MKLKTSVVAAAAALLMHSAAPASAHVWNIGWDSVGGALTFFGLSYHGGSVGGAGSVDDFSANPAGLVVNGTNISFDLGSVVDLNDCNGAGGLTSGTCSPVWNSLGLDGAIMANGYSSSTYGKYATVTLDSSELAALGIGQGSNSVLLSTYANNVDWDGLSFASATVPLNIVVTPPPPDPNVIPVPAGLPLIASALGLLGFAGWRRKTTA